MIYEVESPDGSVIKVEAGDNASDAELIGLAQRQSQPRTEYLGAKSVIVDLPPDKPKPFQVGANVHDTSQAPMLDRFAASAGQMIRAPYLGAKQLFGIGDQKELQRTIDEEKGVLSGAMSTPAGLAGALAGGVASSAIPGGLLAKGGTLLTKAPTIGKAVTTVGQNMIAPTSISGGLLTGAGLAGIQPVGTGESRMQNTVIGGILGGAVPAATTAWRTGKALTEPLTEAGKERILGRMVNAGLGADRNMALDRLANAREIIPGSQPTAAEVAGSGWLASLQRSLAASPAAVNQFTQRGLDQDAARAAAFAPILGDDVARATAVKARAAAIDPLTKQIEKSTAEVPLKSFVRGLDTMIEKTRPLTGLNEPLKQVRNSIIEPYPLVVRMDEAYKSLSDLIVAAPGTLGKADKEMLSEARKLAGRVARETLDGDEALTAIKSMKPQNSYVQGAIDDLKAFIRADDTRIISDPARLQLASQNIRDLISRRGPTGERINEQAARELTRLKNALDKKIADAEPAYGKFMSTYQDKSRPINQMDIGREILVKAARAGEDAAGTQAFLPEKFAKTLQSDSDVVRAATGWKRGSLDAVMEPGQMATLRAINEDLARKTAAQNLGRGSGSDTFQKLAMNNLMEQSRLPGWAFNPMALGAGASMLGHAAMPGLGLLAGPGGFLAGHIGKSAFQHADDVMRDKMALALLNPREIARLARLPEKTRTQETMRLLAQYGAGPIGIGSAAVVAE